MSQENVEIVSGALGRFLASGDVTWELFDEDIEVHDHDIPDRGEYRGHEGFLRWLDDWGAAWKDWRMEPEEVLDDGDYVVVVVRMTRQAAQVAPSSTARTRSSTRSATARSPASTYFNDRQQALEAAGLSE